MACSATLHRSTFIFGKSTPDSRILPALQRPLQTWFANFTSHTYFLRFFNLRDCRSSIANREEEFRVLVLTRCAMAPIHIHPRTSSPSSRPLGVSRSGPSQSGTTRLRSKERRADRSLLPQMGENGVILSRVTRGFKTLALRV